MEWLDRLLQVARKHGVTRLRWGPLRVLLGDLPQQATDAKPSRRKWRTEEEDPDLEDRPS